MKKEMNESSEDHNQVKSKDYFKDNFIVNGILTSIFISLSSQIL
jgi:hypothetical protein